MDTHPSVADAFTRSRAGKIEADGVERCIANLSAARCPSTQAGARRVTDRRPERPRCIRRTRVHRALDQPAATSLAQLRRVG